MTRGFVRILFVLALCLNASAQQDDRNYIPISIPDIIRSQAEAGAAGNPAELNERIRAMAGAARFSQDYLLGPGDVIEVSVFGIDRLENMVRTIDSKGRVSLPYLESVRLIGLTSRESEVKVATLYEQSVLKNPQVSVNVKEYRSQFISVTGAVEKAGIYQLTHRIFLVDALAMAGGLLAEKAESKVYVIRDPMKDSVLPDPAAEFDNKSRIEVDLDRLLEQGDMSLNIPIYAGDIVNVPERIDRYFYVIGDVNRGGAFEMRKGEKITLSQAIASASGWMGTAKTDKSSIMRQMEDGTQLQIPVDVKKVVMGKAEDIELENNDVVFVPGSTTKTIGKAILGSIGSVIYALVVAGVR